jgi:hypothetical protein
MQALGERAAGEPSRPVGARARLAAAAQIVEQRAGARVLERDELHVHDRRRESGGEQHIAEVVHVDEGVHPALARRGAQLLQRIRTERAEHEEPVRREHAAKLAQGRQRVREPVERHVGPDEADRLVRERQRLHVAQTKPTSFDQ